MNNTVHNLRKRGHIVCVNHFRRYFDGPNNRWVHLTNYQYSLINGKAVIGPAARGGYTTVTLKTTDSEFTAEARCSNKENFCKKTGVKLALERIDKVWAEAIKKM